MSSPEEPPERDVLSSLPRTRPQRRSAKRDPVQGATAKPRSTGSPKPRPKAAGGARAKGASGSPPPPPQAAPPRSVEPPSRTDVLAGAVQAAGELAQAGLAVGGELLRVALSRLPRP